ncbi:MAG TPA: amidohydrolase [Sphingomicrobium sp.]|nr:amidohydrolase [Sphingomicrobium sp.]
MRLVNVAYGVILSSLLATAAPVHAAAAADLIVYNGKIFTADSNSRVVQAFAVADGKFVDVGTSRSVLARDKGPKTKLLDLHGAFVSPGLTDDHFHNEGGGAGIDLSHARTLDDLFAAVAAAARTAKPGAVIVSNSDWHEAQLKEQRLPTAIELDRVSPNNPVVLARGGHSLILNSAALKKWNITKATPVPAGGAISRDQSGELTGELFDNAKALVDLPPEAPLSMADIMRTQKMLNEYGITAVRIPGAYKGDLLSAYRLMKQARDAGTLTLRYIVYLPGFTLRSAEQARALLAKWNVKQDEGDDWVRIGGVKLIVDGGFEGGHLSRPYQEPWGKGGTYSGLTVVPQANYTEVVRELNRLGWRPTTHAVGDAGIDEVLTAYSAANADQPIRGKRWAIEHAFVVRPEQLEKLEKLDVALSVQDHLFLAAPVLKRYWGSDIAAHVTPLRTFEKSGLIVAGGTDSPVVPFNPFFELYHFLTRDTMSDGVYGADEAVGSRSDLLKLITINYARLIGEQKHKGSIEPGKLADFAVLSNDFLTVPVKQIPQMKALATYVGGREVYRDSNWSAR